MAILFCTLIAALLAGCSTASNGAPASRPVATAQGHAALSSAFPTNAPTSTQTLRPSTTEKMAPAHAVPRADMPTPRPPAGRALQPATPPPATAANPPRSSAFRSSVAGIDAGIAARMQSSWHPGCPVALPDLRYVTVTYRGFDNADHTGELVVAAAVADAVVDIFRELYDNGFPIASLRLVDDFGGSDDASMAANNSSAFNCRNMTGGTGFSEHSYGTAIDLNPVQNPYRSGDLVLPADGRRYLDRTAAPGVILAGDATVRAFAGHGWHWGGTWSDPVDYQHFSVSGR